MSIFASTASAFALTALTALTAVASPLLRLEDAAKSNFSGILKVCAVRHRF
jgi:hypothetical protein